MVDQDATLIAIGMMAIIIYVTRLCGYFVGLQLRHIRGIQPVLEALPGCAFMAILLPSLRNGVHVDVLGPLCNHPIIQTPLHRQLQTGSRICVDFQLFDWLAGWLAAVFQF